MPDASQVTPGTRVWNYPGSNPVSEVTGSNDAGYIVEGTQLEGQIRHTNDTIEVTDNANLGTPRITQQLGVNTDPTQQKWLEITAGNTTTTNDHLWTNFPEGTNNPFGPDTPNKDPLERFRVQFLQN